MGCFDVLVVESMVCGVNFFLVLFRRDFFVVDYFLILNEKENIYIILVFEFG